MYYFCRPTGFVSHTKHKFALFLLFCCCCFFFFVCVSRCFCYCYYYYYCAESQPIIGALIVNMYVLYVYTYACMCVFVCASFRMCFFFFLSACEAPTTKSRFNFNENPICHECRMSRDPLFLLLDFELHKCIYSWSDKTDALFPLASAYSTFSATIFH